MGRSSYLHSSSSNAVSGSSKSLCPAINTNKLVVVSSTSTKKKVVNRNFKTKNNSKITLKNGFIYGLIAPKIITLSLKVLA